MINYRSTNQSVETTTLTSTLTHLVTMIHDFPLDTHLRKSWAARSLSAGSPVTLGVAPLPQ